MPVTCDRLAIPSDQSGRWNLDAAHQENERGLSAPARPDNGDGLPLLDGEVDVPQGNDTPLIELAADMLERAINGVHGHRGIAFLRPRLRTKAMTALMSP